MSATCSESQEKSKSDSLTLKPCPFCGWDVRIERIPTGFVTIEHPEDVDCILNVMDSMWTGDLEQFIKEWNKRASE